MPKKASHCKNGHPRTPENLYPNRLCKLCSIAYTHEYSGKHVERRSQTAHKRYLRLHPDSPSLRSPKQFFIPFHNPVGRPKSSGVSVAERRRQNTENKKYRIAEAIAAGRNPCLNCVKRDAAPDKLRCSYCITAAQKSNSKRKSSAIYRLKKKRHARRYRIAHPEKNSEWVRKWQKAHPEKSREHFRKYHAMMNGNFTHFTQPEWKGLLNSTGHICLCCRRTEAELKAVGLLLVPDHVVPICDPSDRLKGHRDDISNIQPLCHSNKLGVYGGCNQIKGGKCTDYRTQKSQY